MNLTFLAIIMFICQLSHQKEAALKMLRHHLMGAMRDASLTKRQGPRVDASKNVVGNRLLRVHKV